LFAEIERLKSMNLTQKTVKGIMWSGVSQFTAQGFLFIFKIILARILLPDDFGTFGMAFIFIGFIHSVSELGLSAAIIQKKNITEKHLSTSFLANIIIGSIFCVLTIYSSLYVALFFKKAVICQILRVLSAGFILSSLGIVHQAILTKRIDFKSLAITEIVSAVAMGLVSITLAIAGTGVWSLVIGSLVGNSVKSLLLWVKCSWRPSKCFDFKSFKELFHFGKNVMGSRVLNYIDSNVDYILIGKFLSASSLGLYTLAYQIAIFPLKKIAMFISRVMFPAFSTIQNDNVKLRTAYFKVVKYTALIVFPLLGGLAIIAPKFIVNVIGEKWLPMTLSLQILCFAGALKSVGTHVGSVLLSKGRSDIQIKWNIFTAIIFPIGILIGIRYGINGVATATLVATLALFLIIQKITTRLIDMDFIDFIKALYPATICSTIMMVVLGIFQVVSVLISLQGMVSVVMSIVAGAIIYIGAVRIVDYHVLKEFKVLLREARRR